MTSNKFIRGALILSIAGIICKVLGAFSKIPLTNILTSEGIGLYQLVFPLYSLLLTLSTSGIPIAMSKIISSDNFKSDILKRELFIQSRYVMAILCGILTVLVILFSNVIAKFQGNSKATLCYLIIAPAIFFVGQISVYRGYFQGLQNFVPTAISQIIEQVSKICISLTLAIFFARYGLIYSVSGAVAGITLSELFAVMYLKVSYKNKYLNIDDKTVVSSQKKKQIRNILVKTATPITINSIILPIIYLIDSAMFMNVLQKYFAQNLVTSMYGIEAGVVTSLLNLPIVVITSLSCSIVPSISKNDNNVANTKKCNFAYKAILFVVLPCVAIYLLFGREIFSFLFYSSIGANKFLLDYSTLVLSLTSVSMFYISIMQLSTSVLQAKNILVFPVVILSIVGVIKIILNIILLNIQNLNVLAIPVSCVLLYAICGIIDLIIVKNNVSFNLNIFKHILIPFTSIIVFSVISKNFVSGIENNFLQLLIGCLVIIVPYFIVLFLTKFFDKSEFKKFSKKHV